MTDIDPLPETPPTEQGPRWGRRIAYVAVVLLLLAFAGLSYLQYAGNRRLAAVLAELERQDPGWRLADIEVRRRSYPDEENGMLCVRAARAALPRPWPDWQKFLSAQGAEDAVEEASQLETSLQDQDPATRLNARQVQALRTELPRASAALAEARKLADRPHGRASVNWAPDFISTLLPHVQEAREIASLLGYDVLLRTEEGDLAGALQSWWGLFHTGEAIGDEPIMISQLVRIACRSLALRKLERVLAQGQPAEADLAALQRFLTEAAEEPLCLHGVRGERAALDSMMQSIEDGKVSAWQLRNALRSSPLGGGPRFTVEDVAFFLGLGSFKKSRAVVLQHASEAVEIARGPIEDILPRYAAWQASANRLPPLARLIVPSHDKYAGACVRHCAQMRCAATLVAVERFRLARGRWPETLAALVPEGFLTRVPTDPFSRKPLRLQPLEDGIAVYSVGPDGQDDGGNLHPQANVTGTDLGMRLWNLERRRQPAKPPPPRRSVAEQTQPIGSSDPGPTPPPRESPVP